MITATRVFLPPAGMQGATASSLPAGNGGGVKRDTETDYITGLKEQQNAKGCLW
jgi:hypothetical protein